MTTEPQGYALTISNALGIQDAPTLELVEAMMREDTGGVLDHLSLAEFNRRARVAFADARAWDEIGPINDMTLRDYCEALRIEAPAWLDTDSGNKA